MLRTLIILVQVSSNNGINNNTQNVFITDYIGKIILIQLRGFLHNIISRITMTISQKFFQVHQMIVHLWNIDDLFAFKKGLASSDMTENLTKY